MWNKKSFKLNWSCHSISLWMTNKWMGFKIFFFSQDKYKISFIRRLSSVYLGWQKNFYWSSSSFDCRQSFCCGNSKLDDDDESRHLNNLEWWKVKVFFTILKKLNNELSDRWLFTSSQFWIINIYNDVGFSSHSLHKSISKVFRTDVQPWWVIHEYQRGMWNDETRWKCCYA